MRDYINRLSRGKSIIEVPKLTFENEQAAMNVDCGKCTEGNFTFTASVQTAGKVYSDNERVNVNRGKGRHRRKLYGSQQCRREGYSICIYM